MDKLLGTSISFFSNNVFKHISSGGCKTLAVGWTSNERMRIRAQVIMMSAVIHPIQQKYMSLFYRENFNLLPNFIIL